MSAAKEQRLFVALKHGAEYHGCDWLNNEKCTIGQQFEYINLVVSPIRRILSLPFFLLKVFTS